MSRLRIELTALACCVFAPLHGSVVHGQTGFATTAPGAMPSFRTPGSYQRLSGRDNPALRYFGGSKYRPSEGWIDLVGYMFDVQSRTDVGVIVQKKEIEMKRFDETLIVSFHLADPASQPLLEAVRLGRSSAPPSWRHGRAASGSGTR